MEQTVLTRSAKSAQEGEELLKNLKALMSELDAGQELEDLIKKTIKTNSLTTSKME